MFSFGYAALDRNLGPDTLLLRLIPRDLYNACPHRQFHTLYSNMAFSTVTLDYQPRTLKGLSQIVPGARSASKYCYLSHIIYLTVRAPGLICESPLMLACQAEVWVGSSYCFIMVFGIMRPGREPMTSCMRDGHAYHYPPPPRRGHVVMLVGWLCLTSHRQRGHLETAPLFNVPCEGREARILHRPHRESNPGRRVAVHYVTAAPRQLHYRSNVSL